MTVHELIEKLGVMDKLNPNAEVHIDFVSGGFLTCDDVNYGDYITEDGQGVVENTDVYIVAKNYW